MRNRTIPSRKTQFDDLFLSIHVVGIHFRRNNSTNHERKPFRPIAANATKQAFRRSPLIAVKTRTETTHKRPHRREKLFRHTVAPGIRFIDGNDLVTPPLRAGSGRRKALQPPPPCAERAEPVSIVEATGCAGVSIYPYFHRLRRSLCPSLAGRHENPVQARSQRVPHRTSRGRNPRPHRPLWGGLRPIRQRPPRADNLPPPKTHPVTSRPFPRQSRRGLFSGLQPQRSSPDQTVSRPVITGPAILGRNQPASMPATRLYLTPDPDHPGGSEWRLDAGEPTPATRTLEREIAPNPSRLRRPHNPAYGPLQCCLFVGPSPVPASLSYALTRGHRTHEKPTPARTSDRARTDPPVSDPGPGMGLRPPPDSGDRTAAAMLRPHGDPMGTRAASRPV